MDKLTQLPASIHGYDMFFEKVSQKNLEQIARDQHGVCSSDPDIKKVTCKFSQPVVIKDASELFSILFAVRISGEKIAKDYGGTYLGGELYFTDIGAKSSTLDSLFLQTL